MEILLTGATGFIGSHLLELLIHQKHNVTILVRKSSDFWRIKPFLTSVEQIDESKLETYFSTTPPQLIFHFATFYTKTHQPKDVGMMIDSNVRLPSTLLELAHQHQTPYFINIGTCFEYQQSTKKISEETIPVPYNLYASTKLAFEHILKYYADQKKINALTLRLFYPYGENDNEKVIPLMIKSVLAQQKLVISKGEQQLDYLYVSDIIDACIKSLKFIQSKQYQQYEVFNIGEGKGKKLKDIAQILNTFAKKQLIFCEKEYPPNDIMQMVADISKAKRMLGWKPNVPIETGLQRVMQYYKTYEKKHP